MLRFFFAMDNNKITVIRAVVNFLYDPISTRLRGPLHSSQLASEWVASVDIELLNFRELLYSEMFG